jgi:hypothetical protein
MNKMSFLKKLLEPVSSIEDFIDWLLYLVGIVFLFLGFSGLLMLIVYPKIYNSDEVIQFATSFVYSYMVILGIFLIAYHSKIIVKRYRT